jgi:dTDP-4-dehydrorhamnose 3,5-epimerase
MKIAPTAIADVVLIEPRVFEDDRGFFFESFNERRIGDALGIEAHFVQDNHSASTRDVVRGLHYQVQHTQGKLVRAIVGEIFDVAVDLRRSSPTFGRWVGVTLTAEQKNQLWIPPGFAHGFAVVSDKAEVLYKTTDYYAPEHDRTIIWNDPTLAIDWPVAGEPALSPKDAKGIRFADADLFP